MYLNYQISGSACTLGACGAFIRVIMDIQKLL